MFKKKKMIYKDITNIIMNICGRFKGISTVKYQSDILNNKQGNDKPIQVFIDDITNHQFNLTTNIVKVEYNIYILMTPKKDAEGILNAQDEAYNAALNILYKIDNMDEYKGILSVYDYSIITVSHMTDNDSAGVKLSLVLRIPNGVNLCEINDNFNDEAIKPEEDNEITLKEKEEVNDIDLKPVKLPSNKKKKGC